MPTANQQPLNEILVPSQFSISKANYVKAPLRQQWLKSIKQQMTIPRI
jgi:hypothetical protein